VKVSRLVRVLEQQLNEDVLEQTAPFPQRAEVRGVKTVNHFIMSSVRSSGANTPSLPGGKRPASAASSSNGHLILKRQLMGEYCLLRLAPSLHNRGDRK